MISNFVVGLRYYCSETHDNKKLRRVELLKSGPHMGEILLVFEGAFSILLKEARSVFAAERECSKLLTDKLVH